MFVVGLQRAVTQRMHCTHQSNRQQQQKNCRSENNTQLRCTAATKNWLNECTNIEFSISHIQSSCWKSNNGESTRASKKYVIFSFFVLLSSLSLRVFHFPFPFVLSAPFFFAAKNERHIDCMINSSNFCRLKKVNDFFSLSSMHCVFFHISFIENMRDFSNEANEKKSCV